MKYVSVIFIALIVTLSACTKEGTGIDTGALTGKNWVQTAETASPAIDYDMDGDTETDLFQFSDACEKDNFVNFNTSGTVSIDEGATKCNAGDPQTQTASWAWINGNTALAITFPGGGGDTIGIKSLSSSTLQLQNVHDYNGTDVTVTETYSAQ